MVKGQSRVYSGSKLSLGGNLENTEDTMSAKQMLRQRRSSICTDWGLIGNWKQEKKIEIWKYIKPKKPKVTWNNVDRNLRIKYCEKSWERPRTHKCLSPVFHLEPSWVSLFKNSSVTKIQVRFVSHYSRSAHFLVRQSNISLNFRNFLWCFVNCRYKQTFI